MSEVSATIMKQECREKQNPELMSVEGLVHLRQVLHNRNGTDLPAQGDIESSDRDILNAIIMEQNKVLRQQATDILKSKEELETSLKAEQVLCCRLILHLSIFFTAIVFTCYYCTTVPL